MAGKSQSDDFQPKKEHLQKLLDDAGFSGSYDFLYLPMKFISKLPFGHSKKFPQHWHWSVAKNRSTNQVSTRMSFPSLQTDLLDHPRF